MLNPHARPALSPIAMYRSLWGNRRLIARLAKRDLLARYRGSFGGLVWSVVTPVLMLAVYTFVFSVVFNARWGQAEEQSKTQFALILFVGLVLHGLFAEVINAAPTMISSQTNYVKKVVFPLEILPAVQLCVALFQCVVSTAVLLTAVWWFNDTVSPFAPLFLLVLLPLALGTLGFAWLIASLAVYIRDLGQITQVLTTVLLFLSPVFFPLSAVPDNFRSAMQLNPLSFLIEQARQVLIWGQPPDWLGLLKFSLGAAIVAWLGYMWFQMTRKGFSDVL